MERRRRRWEGMRRRPILVLLACVATAAATLASPVPPAEAATTGSLTIVVDTAPSDGVDVGFTGCLGSGCGRFTLDDDGGTDATLPDRITATGLAPGTYTVTQDPSADWTLTGLRCVGGGTTDLAAGRATIELTDGAAVTCTFKSWAPWIDVVHDTSPDDARDFTYTGCLDADCGSFVLDGDPTSATPSTVRASHLRFGTYTVTLERDPLWTVTNIICGGTPVRDLPGQRVIIVVDQPSDNVSCRVTVETERLTVVVDDLAGSGGDHTFSSCLVGADCGGFTLDDDDFTDATNADRVSSGPVPAGTYAITLDDDPDREVVAIGCSSGVFTTDLAARRATVALAPSQHPVCTFTTRPTGES